MRKAYLFTWLIMALLIISSCRKEASYYYPKIKGVEAILLTDKRVWLNMDEVIDYSSISYYGFCMDILPNPSLESNQQKMHSTSIPIVYSDLNPNREYFIRPWASNHFGYTYGADIKVSELNPIYTSFHEEINANTWLDGYHEWKSIDSVSVPILVDNRWHIYASTDSTEIELSFDNMIEGAYVTKAYGKTSYPSEVIVEFTIDGKTYQPYRNDLIEVKKVNAKQRSIFIPNAKWRGNNIQQQPLIGHILTP